MASRLPAVKVAEWPEKAGEFVFYTDSAGVISGLVYMCPCGCGVDSSIPFSGRSPEETKGPLWNWDGDVSSPSVTPSIRRLSGCQWHGWITDGEWITC